MATPAARSSARPLVAVYAVLVAYATLHPFDGWRWPPGVAWTELAALPWPRWRNRFDEWSNFAGYLPFGALLFVARVRGGARAGAGLAWAIALPVVWSFLLEVLQGFVPSRVPSARDWALNSAGAVVGAGLAGLVYHWGGLRRWHAWRARWLGVPFGGGLALLLLWPAALLFPAPLPLGLGQWFGPLQELLGALLEGTPWAELMQTEPEVAVVGAGLSPLAEVLAIALGLLAPCLVAYVSLAPGWRRVPAVLVLTALAVLTTTLSTALNFGPAHALAWATPRVLPALAAGVLAALLLWRLPSRLAAACGLVVLTAGVTLVAHAPQDPYFAASLQLWEQGQFIRFHGMAQWVGWLWPFAAGAWLLGRLAAPR